MYNADLKGTTYCIIILCKQYDGPFAIKLNTYTLFNQHVELFYRCKYNFRKRNAIGIRPSFSRRARHCK